MIVQAAEEENPILLAIFVLFLLLALLLSLPLMYRKPLTMRRGGLDRCRPHLATDSQGRTPQSGIPRSHSFDVER